MSKETEKSSGSNDEETFDLRASIPPDDQTAEKPTLEPEFGVLPNEQTIAKAIVEEAKRVEQAKKDKEKSERIRNLIKAMLGR